MTDLTLCVNCECPLGYHCQRYHQKVGPYQSVSMFTPNSDNTCDYFIETMEVKHADGFNHKLGQRNTGRG